MSRINVMQPWMGREEIDAIADAIASGWVAQGPRVRAFESAFADAVRAEHAVAVSSGTAALHLALVVAGVAAGDDVVVPSLSFIATANAAAYVGARAVFADVDRRDGNLTPDTVAAALTPATTAVIVVDQGGVPVDLDGIRARCAPRGILVIEDAACAAGSSYRGRPVGAGADIATWSFHPRKIVTTGEGGMITTASAAWADRARALREHAMSISAEQRHISVLPPAERYTEVGFNFRMTDVQAAMGLVQLSRLSGVVRRRRALAGNYAKAIADVPGLRLVADPPFGATNFQSCWIDIGRDYGVDREGLMVALAAADISARRGIMAAHRQPAYRGGNHGDADLTATEYLTDHTLILPLYHQMSDSEQARVIDVLRTAAR